MYVSLVDTAVTVKVAKALIVKYKYTNPLIETLQEEEEQRKKNKNPLGKWIAILASKSKNLL